MHVVSEYESATEDSKDAGAEEEESEEGSEDEEEETEEETEEGSEDEEEEEYTDEDVIVEGEDQIEEERQSGDGEEQPDKENVDDDEDKKNPAYVPRKGAFYEHDTRTGEEDQEPEKDLKPKKKLWQDEGKWGHDRYHEDLQAPKSPGEVADTGEKRNQMVQTTKSRGTISRLVLPHDKNRVDPSAIPHSVRGMPQKQATQIRLNNWTRNSLSNRLLLAQNLASIIREAKKKNSQDRSGEEEERNQDLQDTDTEPAIFQEEPIAMESAGTGLKINRKKTELMKINTTANTPVTVGGEPIREVESFVYLGSVVDGQGGTDRDVTARIGKARAAMVMLKNVWASKVVSIRTKLRIFNSNVKPVLLYGCETWRTTKTMQQKIQTFLNTCLRRIFNIRWPEKFRNEELWERAGQEPVAKQILRRKWGWIGHTLRKPASSTTRQALTWNPPRKRKRGRPRNSWRRDTEAELCKQGTNWTGVARLAQNRVRWRRVVDGLCSTWSQGPKCSSKHKAAQANSAHIMVPVEGRKTSVKSKQNVRCPRHADKELNLYCTNCELVICSACAATQHTDCPEKVAMEEHADQERDELKHCHNKYSQVMKFFSEQRRGVEETAAALNTKRRGCQSEVRKFFSVLIKACMDVEGSLLEELEMAVSDHTDLLQEHSGAWLQLQENMQQLMDLTYNLHVLPSAGSGAEMRILQTLKVDKGCWGLAALDDHTLVASSVDRDLPARTFASAARNTALHLIIQLAAATTNLDLYKRDQNDIINWRKITVIMSPVQLFDDNAMS
nr:hypothetical protein BaRGS_000280 [Batillaria attramentaria]